LLNIFSFLFNNTLRKLTFNCRGIMARITLWGELAHFINENVIGKATTIVVTSTMVVSPQFKGKIFKNIYYN
jgi:hypothetical protein